MKKTTEKLLRTPADQPAPAGLPPRPAFGRGTKTPPQDQSGFNFNDLPGREEHTTQTPRWMIPIVIATAIGILLGAWYFISVTLAFKTAIAMNQTSIPGPYPSTAVLFVIIPAFCGPFYFLMDYLGLKTGINPFTTPAGIAATILIGALLLLLSFLPVSVIRHTDNIFATQHGYTYCSSVFDPQRVHTYALQSYVSAYGCPTVAPP